MLCFSQIPLDRERCYLTLSHIFLKWKGPNEDSVTTKSYLENSNDVEITFINHRVTITLDDSHRWKEVDFSVSFNTSAGLSPWSNWVSVSGASNGKCMRVYM